ncbi:MAG: glycoside hydrolase family 2 TIM barrel-domain containing protein, partial [Anaerolineae bacterium]|nr:glycoside hydrolase family 2 TIM barrel-domain containing protein [Anaerolineae bacterium]
SSPSRGVAPQPTGDCRQRISLTGSWERYVAGTLRDSVQVPSSLRPSGFYRLQRQVFLPRLVVGQRVIVHFDAIMNHGTVYFNGCWVGEMGPYVPYEFDVTPHVVEGSNLVAVDIADLGPAPEGRGEGEADLNNNYGWETYGGIVRDAYLELRPGAYIENLRLAYEFSEDWREATCRARLFLSALSPGPASLRVTLNDGTRTVTEVERSVTLPAGQSQVELQFAVGSPSLWSPERPALYRLAAELATAHGADALSVRTGFRSFVVRGNTFELNGRPVVLQGVCRHDMWKDQGFTLSREQMAHDMRMIKDLGCNYVRLVHYPHDRHIVELADELGLLVSEEPGYWGAHFPTEARAMVEAGLRVLEGTIRRDWNSPSVVAWLCANECAYTVEFLKEAKALCRSLDPLARPVSAANCYPMEEVKPVFEEAEMDFFTQHPYTKDLTFFQRAAEFYGSTKPLVFTEWGGKETGDRYNMASTVDQLLDLVDAGQLAGHAFWSWNDIPQFTRICCEMHRGILESGVVTETRRPRPPMVAQLTRLFQGRRERGRPQCALTSGYPWSAGAHFTPLDLQALVASAAGERAWADLEQRMRRFWEASGMDQWQRTGGRLLFWEPAETTIGGIAFVSPAIGRHIRPVVVGPATPEIDIPVGMACARIHILGNVTLPAGYPGRGVLLGSLLRWRDRSEPSFDEADLPWFQLGAQVGYYRVHYADGTVDEIPLRHGYEIARANIIQDATRVDPVASRAPRAVLFVKDVSREQYQALLFSIPTGGRKVERLTCLMEAPGLCLALFAVTLEQEGARQ